MPQLKMTDAAIQKVSAAPGERVDFFDAHPRDRQRGLVLRVSATGDNVSRSWAVLFRLKGDSKLRRATVGQYPGMTLAQARDAAAEIVTAARRGVDLVGERDRAVRAERAKDRNTIEAAVKAFLHDWETRPKRRGGMRSASYVGTLRQLFDNRILPDWRGRRVDEITRGDVDALVTKVAKDAPVLANRCLAAIKALCNWAIRRELIDRNPAALVERPGVERARDRVLTAEELRDLWPVIVATPYPFGPAFKLMVLTGQRRDEVGGMRWDEIDAEGATWTLPASRTKGRRVHVVPLSADALAVIKSLEATRREDCPFVFSTTEHSAISGYSRAKRTLDKAITEARAKAEKSPLPRWTLHDLRRTCATEMSRLGVPRFTIARVLNHVDAEITGVYDRHSHLPEKRAALDRWAEYLRGLMNPQDKVTSITTRRRAKASAHA